MCTYIYELNSLFILVEPNGFIKLKLTVTVNQINTNNE